MLAVVGALAGGGLIAAAVLCYFVLRKWESRDRHDKAVRAYGTGHARVVTASDCLETNVDLLPLAEFGRCVWQKAHGGPIEHGDNLCIAYIRRSTSSGGDMSRGGRASAEEKASKHSSSNAGNSPNLLLICSESTTEADICSAVLRPACALVKWAFRLNPLLVRASVVVLLERKKQGAGPQILITQRAAHMRTYPNAWVFPGGQIDPGEHAPEAAAARELREETGQLVDSKSLQLIGVWQAHVATSLRQYIMMIYKGTSPGTKETALHLEPSEVRSAAWISTDVARILSESKSPDCAKVHVPVHTFVEEKRGVFTAETRQKGNKRALRERSLPLHEIHRSLADGHRFGIRMWLATKKN